MEPPSPDWRPRFESHLRSLQARTGVPGVAVSIFTADEVLLSAGYGHRDREAGTPVTEDTIFGIASITKSFTSLAVLQLASEGRLSVDDRVDKHLPFTLWQGREPALVHHFMNNSSGLPPMPTMDWVRSASQVGDPVNAPTEAAEPPPDVTSFERLIAWIDANVELLDPPGTTFSYSNDAFCLLGAIVEGISGMSFDRYVERHILQPLGMSRSTFDLATVLADPDHTQLYAKDESGAVMPSPQWQSTGRFLGGGMLKSTLADLRRYVRYLMDPQQAGRLGVDPKLAEAMRSSHILAGPGQGYAYGLSRRDDHLGLTLIGHGGSLKGVSSQIGWVPELGIGGVVLSNLAGIPSEGIWVSGVNAVAGLPIDTPSYRPEPQPVPREEIDPLLGRYASGEPYGRVHLYRDRAGELRAAVGVPVEDVPATVVSRDELALRFAERTAPLTVMRHPDGSVRGVHYGLRALLRQEAAAA